MSYYILNWLGPREEAAGSLRAGMWGVDADERYANALAAGDRVLIYVGAPTREFIGRAELASPVHHLSGSASGVRVAQIEEWDPPVAMSAALEQLSSNPYAKADFDTGVVLITEKEYEIVATLAGERD